MLLRFLSLRDGCQFQQIGLPSDFDLFLDGASRRLVRGSDGEMMDFPDGLCLLILILDLRVTAGIRERAVMVRLVCLKPSEDLDLMHRYRPVLQVT